MGARLCAFAREDPRFDLVAEIDLQGNGNASLQSIAPLDAIVDFSSDKGAADALQLALQHDAALLVGTTGLSRQTLSDIEVASRNIPVMVAPNTSVGVAVLSHLVAVASRLLSDRYDVDLIEVHHAGKRDAPSGTALRIAEAMREQGGREIPPDRIHALRSGDVVGEHTVEFSGPGERIRLAHLATNRDLFVRGALEAVAWLVGRPAGRYTIEQSLGLGQPEPARP